MVMLQTRMRREQAGFTLIELLIVVVILGILTAIAIPSYLTFTGRAKDRASQANVRSVIPSIESYYSDNNTYSGMTLAALQSTYDQALDLSTYSLMSVTASSYCIQSPAAGGAHSAYKNGPVASIVSGSCP
jgi:type IV pilus assembly protein PilA